MTQPVQQVTTAPRTDMKVVNLSDYELTPNHISLLQKGLSFSPVSNMDEFTVYKDIVLFLRKVFLKSLYTESDIPTDTTMSPNTDDEQALEILNSLLLESDGLTQSDAPIRRRANLQIRSQKMPPLSKNKWLQIFLELVQTDLERVDWSQKITDNLTTDERQVLTDLQEQSNIVIKKSDKGGNVVLLNQQYYEQEVKRLLSDTSTYRRLDSNPFPHLVMELNTKLTWAKDEGLLTQREFEHLFVREFNVPTFYIIPKIHKNLHKPPGRPIVSACQGPLEKVGRYLDSLLKEMVTNLKSYVQDTRHVLARISELEVLEQQDDVLLVGIDVESLYTSIPHACGIEAVKNFLEQSYPESGPQNEFLLELLDFALLNNYFQFLTTYYQQIRGTSMGAAWAPAYACLHLGLWEEEDVYPLPMYHSHAHTWLRYIDDVLMIWTGTVTDLHTFMTQLNINQRNIRLTYNFDRTSLPFLDLLITLQDGHLFTRTFRKETSANTLLSATCHHAHWLRNIIPVGQFLRIKRNCTKTSDYRKESIELYARFRERGYSNQKGVTKSSSQGSRQFTHITHS